MLILSIFRERLKDIFFLFEIETMDDFIYQFFAWTCLFSSVILKIPQLWTVIKTSSAKGLSTSGTCFELWAYSATMSYQVAAGMPFMQYADYVALMFQEIPLLLLVIYHNRHFNTNTIAFGAVYSAVFGSVLGGVSSPMFNAMLIVSSCVFTSILEFNSFV